MNLENFRAIAGRFNLPSEPPAVEEDGSGVWVIRQASSPPLEGVLGPDAPAISLHVEALGGTPDEALANYRRLVVLRAALVLPALRDAVARARAFVVSGDAAIAAIEAERASA